MRFYHRLLIFSLVLVIPGGLVLFLLSQEESSSDLTPSLLSPIKALYQGGRLEEARSSFEPVLDELILEKEGCELVLSVYAKLELYSELYDSAQKCLSKGKGISGITYEALALSALKLEKSKETLPLLEQELRHRPSDRLIASLAQLALESGEKEKAREFFLLLIKSSKIWSAWLARILKFEEALNEPSFIERLIALVEAKDFVSTQSEEKLLRYAKLYKLDSAIVVLEARLSKA